MQRTVVLNVVGLSAALIGDQTPELRRFARAGTERAIQGVLPAVTCSVQASYLTGLLPRDHGIVGNGWYFRELAEVMLWKQSNHLVYGEKVWETARQTQPDFTCAKLFWWYNMYSSADWSVTPRPIYWADGLKFPDFYAQPRELYAELKQKLGEFPLFQFWGPGANLTSSRWIADCARYIYDTRKPALTLVYLPHLDYDLQRYGPDHPASQKALAAIDALCGELIEHFRRDGARVLVLSEYGIQAVSGAVPINRVLRKAGLIAVREECGLEKLDAGASEAFAVADHQVAHVYVRRPERVTEVKRLLEACPGVEQVLGRAGQAEYGLDHPRSGELVAVSQKDRWFSYYYWLDDERAPEFARTVDIHRKPGYDPVELFLDPDLALPKLKLGFTLLKKQLGFRYLMDVISFKTELVKGSHGRLPDRPEDGAVLLAEEPLPAASLSVAQVRDLILGRPLL